MGGLVAFAIRKEGRTRTYVLTKHAASQVAFGRIYEGQGWVIDGIEEGADSEAIFAPHQYGLVVMDFDQKWAGGIQNYTDFHSAYLYFDDPHDKEELRCLWGQGRIEGEVKNYREAVRPIEETDVERYISEQAPISSVHLRIKPYPGWTNEEFENDAAGWEAFMTALARRGFDLDPTEEPAWISHLQKYEIDPNIPAKVRAQFEAEDLGAATLAVARAGSKVRI